MLADSHADVGHSWDLDQKRNGTEHTLINQTQDWDKIAEHMMLNFAESSHQIVRATSALERGRNYEAKEKERSLFNLTVVKKTLN